jgi:hypothetical protein
MYINNAWELLGQKQIVIDLTDYVKNTDYATSNKGGVVKTGAGLSLNVNGTTIADTKTYAQYNDSGNVLFIGKGTLENVITGKGLVSNTDYATNSTGGVIKASDGCLMRANGTMYCDTRTYANYISAGNSLFISKGTLDNVLTAKIGDIQTLLDALDNGAGV